MKKSFVLYHDSYEAIKDLSIEEKGQLLDMIFSYVTGNEIQENGPVVSMAFRFIKVTLDRDAKSWEQKAVRNRENGKLGGRPKQNTNEINDIKNNPENPDGYLETERLKNNPENPNGAVSGSVNVSGNVNVSVNGKELKDLSDSRESERTKKTIFIQPTIEEISAYCRERNNGVDPVRFHAFYDSKGWMIGKNKMKNWKSAIVTWEKTETTKRGRLNLDTRNKIYTGTPEEELKQRPWMRGNPDVQDPR